MSVLATADVDKLRAKAQKELDGALAARERLAATKDSAEKTLATVADKITANEARITEAQRDIKWLDDFAGVDAPIGGDAEGPITDETD